MSEIFQANYNVSGWSATKFVENSNTSIRNTATSSNSLSQRIIFIQKRISIGPVNLLLTKVNPNPATTFDINLSVVQSDADGIPQTTILQTVSLSSSSMSEEGWYEFLFSIAEMDSPENGLCLVFSQSGGDDNNYASWAYSLLPGSSDAYTKGSTGDWAMQSGIHRTMRVASAFDPFANIPGSIITPPGIVSVGTGTLEDGTFDGTILTNTPGQYPVYGSPGIPVVTLDPKDLHVSFVIDSSGSMGWNDRFGMRKIITQEIYDRFNSTYPRNVTYDLINFGGRELNVLSPSLNKRPLGVFVDINDYSSISGYDTDGNPLDNDVKGHLNSGVVSYGFKNLRTSATYVLNGIDLGWKTLSFPSVGNQWHDIWSTGSPSLSVAENGPNDQASVNFSISDSSKGATRYRFGGSNTSRSNLISSALTGATSFNVNDASLFQINEFISAVDIDGFQLNNIVTASDSVANTVTINGQTYQDFITSSGAFIEHYDPLLNDSGWGDTNGFEFFMLDESQSGTITFYIQTANGAHIEWDFIPLSEWELANLYYLDETALFEVFAVDANDVPLADGTAVEFYVDKNPIEDIESQVKIQQKEYFLTEDASIGATFVFVSTDNIKNIQREDTIDIVDDENNPSGIADGGPKTYHTSTVTAVDESTGKVSFSDALTVAFITDNNAKILKPSTDTTGEFDVNLTKELDIKANLVDITPIYDGESLPSELYDELDPPPVSPSSGVDDYNSSPDHVRRTTIEVLTKNGYSAVRLGPITEDAFLSPAVRKALARSMFNLSEREQVRLNALADLEKGELKDGIDDTEYDTGAIETTEEVKPVYFDGEDPDFTIDHKVTVFDGYTYTQMTSFAESLVEIEIGKQNPQKYLAKTYSIYPVITLYDNDGAETTKILMQDFKTYFAAPIYIKNSVDKTVTYRSCPSGDPEVPPSDINVAGTYATKEEPVTISYEITDKGFPVDGTLVINIYDARRTPETRTASDNDLGNIDGCGDTGSLDGGENSYSLIDDNGEYETTLIDKVLADDILGEDFSSSFTVEIVGGQVSVELPVVNRESLLEVHAIFEFDNESKRFVNMQKIYYKNPVVIQITGAGSGFAADGETKYNLGAYVTWMEEYPVDDGTIVDFESGNTGISPSISQTILGTADGVLIGPHEPIPIPDDLLELAEGAGTELETVSASTSFRGFNSTKTDDITWGQAIEPTENFFFYAIGQNTNPNSSLSGTQSLWADGFDYVTVNGDLPASSFKAFPSIDQVTPELLQDKMGVVYTASGFTRDSRMPRWSENPPAEGPYQTDDDVPVGWVTNKMYTNKFIGRPPYREEDPENTRPCNSPECQYVTLYTKARKSNVIGIGIESDTVSFLTSTPSGSPADIPKPRVFPVEPLGITINLEPYDRSEYQQSDWRRPTDGESPKSSGFDTYSSPINRDGQSKYLAVAEVTWRDEFLRGTSGNPLPDVTFTVGEFSLDDNGNVEFKKFEDPSDFPLDSPTASVSHLRTSADASHYHEVVVDDNGIGKTTKTIVYANGVVIGDHEHDINLSSDDIISEESTSDGDGNTLRHSHNLKSVAIVGVGPVTNKTLSVAVRADVSYDNGKINNDGTRVQRTLENYAFAYPTGTAGVFETNYNLEIIPVGQQYVEGKVVDGFQTRTSGSDPGHTVLFKATITTESGDEIPVADGTRIFAQFDFYEFEENDEQTEDTGITVITKNDEPKNYAVLKIGAFISEIPDEVKAESKVVIVTKTNWIPDNSAFSLIRKPTNDEFVMSDAINSYYELGASQYNDAIALAARRMIKFEDELSNSKKIIILIGEGSENTSELSFDQALEEVAAVDRSNNVEIYAIKINDTTLYDELVMKKFSTGSNGELIAISDIIGTISQTAEAVVDSIINSPSFDIVTGTYTNTIDLGDIKLFSSLSFNITVPVGSSLAFRVRFSDDNISFAEWYDLGSGPDFIIPNEIASGRYMQYQVTFRGDPDTFESPELFGVEYEYYEPRGYTLFFQPFEVKDGKDGYVGEIIFTHHGTIPETSTIKYGIAHGNSSMKEDYYSDDQPLMLDGYGGIVLSRVNETLVRFDSKTYVAAYGRWSNLYTVEVYKISDENKLGILVPSNLYSFDHKTGYVNFATSQSSDDVFTITLGLKPVFKIMVDMFNRGEETIELDYLGAMYRTIDRSDIHAGVDRRPIGSIVETDIVSLGIESSGSLSVVLSVFNTEIGNDSDEIIDILLDDGVYYILAWNGESAYLASLRENLTFIEATILPLSLKPISFDLMDGIWNIAYINGNAYQVIRLDSNFVEINTSDAGFTDEHSGIIRSRLDRWYIPNSNEIIVKNISFETRGVIALDAEISPLLSVSTDHFSAISAFRDVIFNFGLEGETLSIYTLETRAVSVTNLRDLDGSLFLVEPNRVTKLG